jgi:hypothetical protein
MRRDVLPPCIGTFIGSGSFRLFPDDRAALEKRPQFALELAEAALETDAAMSGETFLRSAALERLSPRLPCHFFHSALSNSLLDLVLLDCVFVSRLRPSLPRRALCCLICLSILHWSVSLRRMMSDDY